MNPDQGDAPVNPLPADTKEPEKKVVWSAVAAYLAGLIGLAVVNAMTADDNKLLLAAVPDAYEPFVVPLVPALVAFVAGYVAKHQWRTTELRAGINRP